MMWPKIVGGAAIAAGVVMVTLLIGLIMAPASTAALTTRDTATTADTDPPTGVTNGFAPIPHVIPGVGVVPRTGY